MDTPAKIIYGEHMMKGQINCKFIGGKQGEFNQSIPALYCRDRISFKSDVWAAQGSNDQIIIMKGPIPFCAPWLTFTRDVYEKIKPVEPSNVTYQFLYTEEVNRCEKELEGKNRLCRNEAIQGEKFCKVHINNTKLVK
jgi:hypothetical protein